MMEIRAEMMIEEFQLRHPPDFESQLYKINSYKSEINRIRSFLILGVKEEFLSPDEVQFLISKLEEANIRIEELKRNGY